MKKEKAEPKNLHWFQLRSTDVAREKKKFELVRVSIMLIALKRWKRPSKRTEERKKSEWDCDAHAILKWSEMYHLGHVCGRIGWSVVPYLQIRFEAANERCEYNVRALCVSKLWWHNLVMAEKEYRDTRNIYVFMEWTPRMLKFVAVSHIKKKTKSANEKHFCSVLNWIRMNDLEMKEKKTVYNMVILLLFMFARRCKRRNILVHFDWRFVS